MEECCKRAELADGFLFTGGNQLRLTTIFGGTRFIQIILDKYFTEELVVAGTSAGAMALSHTMIMGSSSKALLKNEVKLASKIVGGSGGGGRKDLAQAGGNKPENVDKIYVEIKNEILKLV